MNSERNPEATCATCRYWGKVYSSGECRIGRPVVAGTMQDGYTMFPPMAEDQWCGEHPDFFLEKASPSCEETPLTETVDTTSTEGDSK